MGGFGTWISFILFLTVGLLTVQQYKLLAIAAVIIILRCIFRVVEFAQGHGGYLASHEVYMYVFDTLPMFAVQVLFHVVRADDVFGTNHRAAKKLDSEIIGLYERT